MKLALPAQIDNKTLNVTMELDEDGDILIKYNGITVAWIDSDNGSIKPWVIETDINSNSLDLLGVAINDYMIIVGE